MNTTWILNINKTGIYSWRQYAASGELIAQGDSNTPPTISPQDTCCIALPGTLTRTIHATLPKMKRKMQLSAFPFAIEQDLAQPLHSVHIHIGKQHPDGTIPAWLIANSLWESVANQKIVNSAHWILPEYCYLPWEQDTWTITLTQQNAHLRTGNYKGLSTAKNHLPKILSLLLNETTTPPKQILLYAKDSTQFTPIIAWASKHNIAIIHNMTEAPLNISSLTALDDFNSSKSNHFTTNNNWHKSLFSNRYRWIYGSALLALLLLGAGSVWEITELDAAIAKQQQHINKTFSAAAPGIKLPQDPNKYLRHLRQRLSHTYHGDPTLQLINKVAKVLTPQKNIQVQSIDAKPKQLTMSFTAPDIQDINKLSQDLQIIGLAAQQSEIIIKGKLVTATLTIRSKK